MPPAPTYDVTRDRHTFIGGSEAHELLNERQYGRGCVRALAYRKSGVDPDFSENRSIDPLWTRGKFLEPLVAEMYMAETGRKLIRAGELRRHPRCAGAGVHVDRIALAGHGGVEVTGDAEIKTHGEGPYLNIMRNGLPPGHILQAQWANFVTGHSWCAFIILGVFGELPLKHFDIERDQELMVVFEKEAIRFWETLARKELPPPLPDGNDQRCKVCPWRLKCRGVEIDPDEMARVLAEKDNKQPLTRIEDAELEQALVDYELIRSEIKALDDDDEEDPGALQLVRRKIEELLGSVEHAITGHWKVHCTASTYSGIDTQRLRQEAPEVYERYFIRQRPTGKRRLRVDPIRKTEER